MDDKKPLQSEPGDFGTGKAKPDESTDAKVSNEKFEFGNSSYEMELYEKRRKERIARLEACDEEELNRNIKKMLARIKAKSKAERARRKRDKKNNNLIIQNAIKAFEAGRWSEGFNLAVKTARCSSRILYYLGRYYEDGYSFERNPFQAFDWYSEAAKRGHKDALLRCNRIRKSDYGVSFDKEFVSELPVMKCCREAAERGDAESQANWGLVKLFEEFNYDEAAEWFLKSAVQGNAKGQYFLADAYECGSGVARDEVEALRWYMEAARNGDPRAMKKLKEEYNVTCERRELSKRELQVDYVKGRDGKYHKRVKTGPWLPIRLHWMNDIFWEYVLAIHRFGEISMMNKDFYRVSLGGKIFGKEGAEHEGYGSGALQKWADKMVREGKDPHYVNLLEWFKGASEAIDSQMFGLTFDELMERREEGWDCLKDMLRIMHNAIPNIWNLSRARVYEMDKQTYYTVRYAPYGNTGIGCEETQELLALLQIVDTSLPSVAATRPNTALALWGRARPAGYPAARIAG